MHAPTYSVNICKSIGLDTTPPLADRTLIAFSLLGWGSYARGQLKAYCAHQSDPFRTYLL